MRRNPWHTLAVLAVAQFMVVLDVTIVNVALPHIQTDLHFSADGLQWVISAYTLLFGGFLLLGGRAADLLGRRRLFVVGLGLFAATSLAAGLATTPALLIGMRAIQGLGGALLSPAALSILTVTFAHGRERNIAMGIWGALAGLGGTLGVIAGGVLVDATSWRWVFFVNVPIAVVLIAITPRFVAESRSDQAGRFDLTGAVLGTGGVLALVYGVVRAEPLGWSSAEVIAFLVAAVVLLAAFVLVERRSETALVPARLFASASLRTASGALALNGAAFLGMFFLSALFLQQVRGASALKTGLEFLPMGVTAVVGAVLASTLVTRIGTRPVQLAGAALGAAGLWLLIANATGTSDYLSSILPGFAVFGIGISFVAVPAQIAAIADVAPADAGAASGVVSSTFQVGGALGLAVITTLSNSKLTDALSHGVAQPEALVQAFHRGLLLAAIYALVNLGISAVSRQLVPDAEQLAEAVAA